MPQAQVGKTKSIPKVVRVNAADEEAILYRNLGNGRRLPFIWGTSVTLASGTTSVTVSSGVEFSDLHVTEGLVDITPTNDIGATLSYYADKDTSSNVLTIKSTAAPDTGDATFDVFIMLGTSHDFVSTDSNQIWKPGAHNL
jgi:hypothetical protein